MENTEREDEYESKTMAEFCEKECPYRFDSEAGMPSCDCPFVDYEDE